MTKNIPSYLKLVAETPTEVVPPRDDDFSLLSAACEAFRSATGWRLEYHPGLATSQNKGLTWSAPVNPGVGTSPGHLRIVLDSEAEDSPRVASRIEARAARSLATAVADLWSEVQATRAALWSREADLATQVPVTVRPAQSDSVAERLEAVLRGGAEAVECQAAALYMLDEGTTELKLRASWGLPRKRLVDSARPLQGSLADLEALLGHAVVLEDNQLFDYWKVPEPFGAAVCLPVSSPSIPLGTVWFFSSTPRDFSDAQTNILEVVAGRLASDLENEVLATTAVAIERQQRELIAEAPTQQQLPSIAPSVDGWEIAGAARQAGAASGAFYDWFSQSDDSLAIVAGAAHRSGYNGALVATAMRASVRAGAPEPLPGVALLDRVNGVLWTGALGAGGGGLLHATIQPKSSVIQIATAGLLRAVHVRPGASRALVTPTSLLGVDDTLSAEIRRLAAQPNLEAGELLVIFGLAGLNDNDWLEWNDFDWALGNLLMSELKLPATRLADLANRAVANHLAATATTPEAVDYVSLVIKRRR